MFFKACLVSFTALVSAAPSFHVSTTLQIVNNCPKHINVEQLGDTLVAGTNSIALAAGESRSYRTHGRWSGRFWAREDCHGSGCQPAGAAFPASLAEFTFHADGDQDFYDVSFVDGYNLPISIKPVHPESTDPNNPYWCAMPTCQYVPACPAELQLHIDGEYIGCQSACSKFGNPEYCCAGDFSTPDKCPINSYAAQVKSACPDVYSYAYDDQSSLYACRSKGYVITWCP